MAWRYCLTCYEGPAPAAMARDFLACFERNFPGVRRAYNGRAYYAWSAGDPHTGGAYSYLKTGQYTAFNGIQGRRSGNLHIAGEHTSVNFQGYMEGALRSGYRCAAEIAGGCQPDLGALDRVTRYAATDCRARRDLHRWGCSPNPGPGGWGAILRYGGHEKESDGGEPATTNNRMEIMAAIRGLESLTRPSVVHVHTDSVYLRNGITRWLPGWKRNGWKTSDKKPVKNSDLWTRLDGAARQHTVEWFWVKGHAGHPENERADELACRGSAEAAALAGGRAPGV